MQTAAQLLERRALTAGWSTARRRYDKLAYAAQHEQPQRTGTGVWQRGSLRHTAATANCSHTRRVRMCLAVLSEVLNLSTYVKVHFLLK